MMCGPGSVTIASEQAATFSAIGFTHAICRAAGGKHPKAKVEVHDVAFVVADTLQAAYPALREAWFGSAAGLHIDGWMKVDGVEGWKVELSRWRRRRARHACTS